MPDNEIAYELAVPFVTVKTAGGPHDDDAYAAGFEMGALHMMLHIADGIAVSVRRTIRRESREQADLFAMRHGWTAEFTEFDDKEDPHPEWLRAQFTRSDDA